MRLAKEDETMTIGKRVYWILALVAVFAMAGAAVTMASGITSAGNNSSSAQNCDAQDQNDDANEAEDGANDANEPEDGTNDASDAADVEHDTADTDNIEDQCGPQDEQDDGDTEASAGAGQIDDGAELLPQASITLDQAVAAAQTAASGDLGEIDLEDYQGRLAFNVEIGNSDVKVDAADGSVLGMGED